MESKEPVSPKPINLYDIPLVKERFATVAPQIEISNFLLGAAYCGNSEGSLILGLDDSRNGLTQEQKGRIVLDVLQQLITLTEKVKNDPTITARERYGLLLAAASLIELCTNPQLTKYSKWPSFEIPTEAKLAVEQWGKEAWKEEWAKATDINSHSWFMESGITLANSDYMGVDFVAHCIAAIARKAMLPTVDFSNPQDKIDFLRTFWQQHRPPTTLERLFNRIPKSPYVSSGPGLPTFTTQIYK